MNLLIRFFSFSCLFLLASVPAFSCYQEATYEMYRKRVQAENLTDESVQRYIKTYRVLRANGQNYLKFIEKEGNEPEAYRQMEETIKKGGFQDFGQFVRVNAKIAWAWNLAQARVGLKKQQQLQEWGQHELDKGIRQVEEALADPAVPETAKTELRKTLAELQQGKQRLGSTYKKNMRWAEWAMNFAEPLTNDRDTKIVMRHEKELMEVFTGLSRRQLDEIQDHSLRQLQIR